MLEIIFLIIFGRKVAAMAQEKGYSVGYVGLFVGLWIVGEITGAMVGMSLGLGVGDWGLYVLSLMFAAAGSKIAWSIVKGLPPKPDSEKFEPNGEDLAITKIRDVSDSHAKHDNGRPCPLCNSKKTEIVGSSIICYSCNMTTML